MFPCPNCSSDRRDIESPCNECGWKPDELTNGGDNIKQQSPNGSGRLYGCGQTAFGVAFAFLGLIWFMICFSVLVNYGRGVFPGPFAYLENKGILPHLAPLCAGLVIFFSGLGVSSDRKLLNAIAWIVTFAILIGYLIWML